MLLDILSTSGISEMTAYYNYIDLFWYHFYDFV